MSIDLDALPETAPQNLGKVFTWDGAALEPFSFNRQAALQRLGVIRADGHQSNYEAAVALLILCQTPDAKVVTIRGDSIPAFLLKCGEWAVNNGIGAARVQNAKTKELLALFDSIMEDLDQASEIGPDITNAPGKA
jgi:hypothetical protein